MDGHTSTDSDFKYGVVMAVRLHHSREVFFLNRVMDTLYVVFGLSTGGSDRDRSPLETH